MQRKLLELFAMFGEAWCRMAHPHVTWPVQGRYRCRTCGRQYAVTWESAPAPVAARPTAGPGRGKVGHVALPGLTPPARA